MYKSSIMMHIRMIAIGVCKLGHQYYQMKLPVYTLTFLCKWNFLQCNRFSTLVCSVLTSTCNFIMNGVDLDHMT